MNARSLSAVPVVQSAPERKRSTKPGSLRADRPSFDGNISAFARKASMSARSLSRVVIMAHVYRYGMGAASGKYHKDAAALEFSRVFHRRENFLHFSVDAVESST